MIRENPVFKLSPRHLIFCFNIAWRLKRSNPQNYIIRKQMGENIPPPIFPFLSTNWNSTLFIMVSGTRVKTHYINGRVLVAQLSRQNLTILPSSIFHGVSVKISYQMKPIDFYKWDPYLIGRVWGRFTWSMPYLVSNTWDHRLFGDAIRFHLTFISKALFIKSKFLKLNHHYF